MVTGGLIERWSTLVFPFQDSGRVVRALLPGVEKALRAGLGLKSEPSRSF
jgi:hypothetical protein